MVFDFDGAGGLGNILLGFIQAFHAAMTMGVPLLLVRPPHGTANAVCGPAGVFACGFPMIDEEEVRRVGFVKANTKPSLGEFDRMVAAPEPFKLVMYR